MSGYTFFMVNCEFENKRLNISAKKRKSRISILLHYFTGGGGKEFEVYKNPDQYDDGAHSKLYQRDNLARGVADVIEINVPNMQNTSILDIGAGTGIFSLELARRGFVVIALDLFSEPLNKLNEKAKTEGLVSQVKIVQGDMNLSWPFDDNSFSSVVSLRATRYINDFDAWLGEVYRVLKPHGTFVLPVFFVDTIPWKRHSYKGFHQKTSVRAIMNSIIYAGFVVDAEASQKYTKVVDKSRGAREVPFYYQPTFIVAKKYGYGSI